MPNSVKTVLYPVKDLAASKARFTELIGAPPDSDSPYYVGWNVDGQDIGLVPHGQNQDLTGPLPYFKVPDIEATLNALLDAGAKVVQEAKDVGGGRLVASVTDPEGNAIGVLQDP